MDTAYILFWYQKITDVGVTECVRGKQRALRLTAASSLYDSTKHFFLLNVALTGPGPVAM